MQHLFYCTGMMSSLDQLESYTLTDSDCIILIDPSSELKLAFDLVNRKIVDFLKLFVDFFLHLLVFQKWY